MKRWIGGGKNYMPLLKDDKDALNSIKGTLSSIPSELRDVDSIKALQFRLNTFSCIVA